MSIHRLEPKSVVKPWGRCDLAAPFTSNGNERIGEVWFTDPASKSDPLLVKYLFTSEKLSVQVHPDDPQARAAGLAGGKSECWLVLEAEPDAVLGIGLIRHVDEQALRWAMEDGTIEDLIDWKPVRLGSFYYIPAGTIHAIGAGIKLIEIQQNNDVTYRLYDYGRSRELHLEEGIAVSSLHPCSMPDRLVASRTCEVLLDGTGSPFALESLVVGERGRRRLPAASWFIPIEGRGVIDGQTWQAGECWAVGSAAYLEASRPTRALVAYLPQSASAEGMRIASAN